MTELKLVITTPCQLKLFKVLKLIHLAAITATLAKFGDDEEAWIQLLFVQPPVTGIKAVNAISRNIKQGGGQS